MFRFFGINVLNKILNNKILGEIVLKLSPTSALTTVTPDLIDLTCLTKLPVFTHHRPNFSRTMINYVVELRPEMLGLESR